MPDEGQTGRRVTGRYGEQQRQLGGGEVAGREQERSARRNAPTDSRLSIPAHAPLVDLAAGPPAQRDCVRAGGCSPAARDYHEAIKKKPRRVAGARYLREHVGGRGCASAGRINFEVDISGLCECRLLLKARFLCRLAASACRCVTTHCHIAGLGASCPHARGGALGPLMSTEYSFLRRANVRGRSLSIADN